MSSVEIRINDIFEELNDENKRLLDDLSFANECLIKLVELKNFVELIFIKIRHNLEENQSNKYEKLNNGVNEVLQRRPDIKDLKSIDNEIIDNFVNSENDIKFSHNFAENDNELSDDPNDPDYDISGKVITGRLKILKKKKLKTSETFPERATNGLNVKFKKKRGRKPKNYSNPDTNGIKPKKETIVCDYGDCDQVFKNSNSYEKHKRVVHLKVKAFVCEYPDCHFGTNFKKNLETHLVIHSNKRPFVCDFNDCGKTFKLEAQVKTHKRTVHKLCANLRKCEWPGCDYETVIRSHMAQHMTKHTVREKTVACDWSGCGKMFKTVLKMREHRRNHTAAKNHECNWPGCEYRTFRASLLKQHIRYHYADRPFVCDIDNCGKAYKTGSSLYSHKKSHFPVVNPSRDFKCQFDGCGKDFLQESHLKQHLLTHKPASIHCDWPGCTYSTTRISNLKKHHYVHQDYSERKHVCDWPECGKRFKDNGRLSGHYRLHTNERPYACAYPGCGYRCVLKGNLNKHMAKHSR